MREFKRLKRLKVVFIDWHKTLCSCVFFHELHDVDEALFHKLDSRLFDEMPIEGFIDWMRGKISCREIVHYLSGDDLAPEKVFEVLKNGCEKMFLDRRDFLKWIRKIRKKGKMAVIATDNVDVFAEYTVPALKLRRHFDDILCSSELKCLKTDTADGKLLFFDDFLRKHNIKYEEAILLDDSRETTDLCKKYGMQAKLIRSPEDVLKMLMMIETSCDRDEY